MGLNLSVADGQHTPTPGLYVPVVGTRMNDEKHLARFHYRRPVHQAPPPSDAILKTPYASVWSVITPRESELRPVPRTNYFFCECPSINSAVIGCGVDQEGELLDDIWILNKETCEWVQVKMHGDLVGCRNGPRAVWSGDHLIVFGGQDKTSNFSDVHAIDLKTGESKLIETTGEQPPTIIGPVVGFSNSELFVWGGAEEFLFILSLETREWTKISTEFPGRSGAAYTQIEDKLYIFGASKTGGLLEIELPTRNINLLQTTGNEPPSTLANTTMIAVNGMIFLTGGKSESRTTLVYACDLKRLLWFVFYVVPDGEMTKEQDGCINSNGLFELPRTEHLGASYSKGRREIIAFLGFPLDPTGKIHVLEVGDALSYINLRTDMLETLDFETRADRLAE